MTFIKSNDFYKIFQDLHELTSKLTLLLSHLYFCPVSSNTVDFLYYLLLIYFYLSRTLRTPCGNLYSHIRILFRVFFSSLSFPVFFYKLLNYWFSKCLNCFKKLYVQILRVGLGSSNLSLFRCRSV